MVVTTAEEFIQAWANSESVKEVSGKLGIQVIAVEARAKAWRKKGVKLPKLLSERKTGNKLDVNYLNKLIQETK